MKRLYLILDCNYLAYRAKYIFGDLSYAGSVTGVIYGFLRDVVNLMERFETRRVVFCWDSRYKKRREIFPDYKAHREQKEKTPEEEEFEKTFFQQIRALRKRHLPTIGFRNIFQQKGYEADDIIAAVCLYIIPDLSEGIIVTADQDLFQLIRKNIKWFNPRTGELITLGSFKKKFGIHPHKWAKVKAIAGCVSDNVPGIEGVGNKTAIKYVKNELSETSKKYTDIKRGWNSIVLRNIRLVELPYAGIKYPKLKLRNNTLNQSNWDRITKSLGMKSIRNRSII